MKKKESIKNYLKLKRMGKAKMWNSWIPLYDRYWDNNMVTNSPIIFFYLPYFHACKYLICKAVGWSSTLKTFSKLRFKKMLLKMYDKEDSGFYVLDIQ